jgi:hypothetical protein
MLQAPARLWPRPTAPCTCTQITHKFGRIFSAVSEFANYEQSLINGSIAELGPAVKVRSPCP